MMCSRRVSMSERIVVEEARTVLDPDALLRQLNTEGCGAVVSFVGLTRGIDNGTEILRLEFDAWHEQLRPVLLDLATVATSTYGLHGVAMAHRTGAVGPGEPIVAIHVASPHRKEAFEACSWLNDELKRQAPIWKREVTPLGTTWKEGLG